MADRSPFLAQLLAVDAQLETAGFPAFSTWWQKELRRFLRSSAGTWIVRVGRRGGKSTTWCKVAVAWALFGPWRIPPGDTGVIAFVSVSRDEASARLRTIEAMLKALGVGFTRRGDEVELRDRPVVFRVVSCTTTAVVGFTSILIIGDEVARWRDSEGLANPAAEVVGSLRPTLATQAVHGAFAVLSSSPWTTTDYHAARFEQGEGDGQVVSYAPTWIANPTITEAQTFELEPDERVRSREYLAEPSSGVSAAFPDGIDHVVSWGVRERPPEPGVKYIMTFDLGGPRSATWAQIFHFENRATADRQVMRSPVQDAVRVLQPKLFRLMKKPFAAQCKMLVDLDRQYHPEERVGDRYLSDPVGEALAQEGVRISREPMSMALSAQAARSKALLDVVRAGALDLVDNADLIAQMRNAVLRERAGSFIIESPNKRTHADDALDCVLLAMDERFRKIPASGGASGVRLDVRIVNNYPIDIRRRWVRDLPDGSVVPAAPPVGSEEYRIAVARRWTHGQFTPDELESGRTIDELMLEGARTLDELEG